MEKFLEALRKALEERKVENIEDIIDKYSEHFLVGHEAGMTDEEIIERFGTIDEILNSYSSSTNPENMGYRLSLSLDVFKEFNIEMESGNEIRLETDEKALSQISIERGKKTFSIKSRLITSFRSKRAKYSGTLYVGENLFFEQVFIKNVAADLEICSLKGNEFHIQNVIGNVELDSLDFKKRIKISSTTGDISAKNFLVPNLIIESVNGDFSIGEICCDKVAVKTVNGNITIDVANEADFVINSVNGDICIKEGNAKTLAQYNVNGDISIDGQKVSGGNLSKVMDSLKKTFEDWK